MIQEPLQGFALSPQQEHLWRLQHETGCTLCCVQAEVACRGDLDPAALRAALEAVVLRHDSLRTSLHRLSGLGTPVQVVGEDRTPSWRYSDLALLSPGDQRDEIGHLLREAADLPFQLDAEAPLRTHLVRLGPGDHRLLLTVSAYSADRGSLAVIVRDLALTCAGVGTETEALQYPLIASWSNDLLQSEDAEAGRDYWQALLRSAVAAPLPFAREGAEGCEFRPRERSRRIDAGRAEDLERGAAACGVSLAALCLTAWQAVLARATEQDRVLVGVYFDGRTDEELGSAVGAIARYLPVEGRLDPERSAGETMAEVQAALDEAAQWQECFGWEDLAERGAWASGSQFFPFCFELDELPPAAGVAGLSFHVESQSSRDERFQVKLSLLRGEDLLLRLFYDPQALPGKYVSRLGAQLEAAIDGLLHPGMALRDLDLATAAERQELLVEFNASAAIIPERALHELFAEQAQRTPDRPAVEHADGILTYAALDSISDRLARHLRHLGVGPESMVALCLERSLEMVVSILGVLKAGGAYLPIDPAHPAERVAFMLAEARPVALLTQRSLLDRLPEVPRAFCLDAGWEATVDGDAGSPAGAVHLDSFAYAIYTSGSTGAPKAVMISHRAIVNQVFWICRRFPLGPEDVVFQKTPYSFDASIWELFVPWRWGARLFLAEPGGHQDSAYLAATCRDRGITVLQLVPSLLRVVAEEPAFAGSSALRRLFCGGEALSADLVERCFTLLDAEVVNFYGPTEVSINALFWVARRPLGRRVVPLGSPVANTSGYIVDRELRPLPVGIPGELLLGGIGLARGYLGRPDITAGRFIPDPWSDEPGARLYRTGDLVRWLPDGEIEFLGRVDHQVKLRGLRIELGEIETVLEQHPAVRQAVAVVRDDGLGGAQRLVAYFAVRPGSPIPGTEELRELLQSRLPEYMVPALFIALDALPLLTNGKVDRRALPAPVEVERAAAYAAPRTPVEDLLCQLWAELLQVPRVGLHDDFFELGGHSLLATQLTSRLNQVFQLPLSLRAIFQRPTVAGIAEELEEMGRASFAPPPPLVPVPRGERPPLSYAQQRLWFLHQLEPESPAYNMRSALHLAGRLAVPALEASLTEIVRRHETLRTVFPAEDGIPWQQVQEPSPVRIPVVDLSALPRDEAHRGIGELALREGLAPFDLTVGPLLRLTLARLAPTEHVLLCTVHHAVCDGWSIGVFVRELSTLYRSFLAGAVSPLPELPIQYADYAIWQCGWLSGEVLEAQMEYWRRALAGLSPLELPTDRPRTALRGWQGAIRPFMLPQGLSPAVGGLSRRHNVTLFMTLLAAFDALLWRYTGQGDLAVGTVVANRQRVEVENLIGFFVNTLVLRADLEDDPPFGELLERTRRTFLDAATRQDLPFEKLVDELQPQRSLSHHPLFQVSFVFQNAPAVTLRLPDLELSPVAGEQRTAKFDLMLSLGETAGELGGYFEYATTLLDATTVARMAEHFRNLFAAAVADPSQRLSGLDLLSAAERAELASWNATSVESPEVCIHELFAEVAREAPDRVAVVFADHQVSYGELERRANRLGRRLAGLGVGLEVLVGLCADRSVEMMVGMLGILKAGGAYVPLDPNYPGERLAFMLAETRMPLLVGEQRLVEALPVLGSTRVVWLDAKIDRTPRESVAPLELRTLPENLAYVMYTSGSTGRPKGVAVVHRGVTRLVRGSGFARFSSQEAWLHLAPISFDASTLEIWGALANGGRLVVAPPGQVSLEDLGEVLVREGVTSLWLTAGLFHEMVGHHPAGLAPVRQLLAGGDVLSSEHVRRALTALPGCRLVNGYGPTENTTFTTCHVMDSAARVGTSVSIGRPIANTQVYLLDRAGGLLPVGVVGELAAGGAGLARGYFDRPDVTAERWMPDGVSGKLGARLYRTGDLARWTAAGELEFLGRLDHQVKLRGFRIEPGEIEAALESHPGVKESAVLAREEGNGERRLVAYVVPAGEEVPAAGLREFLHYRLPAYMVPAAFVTIPALPLTSHGKLDRTALPAPDRTALVAAPLSPPETPVEQALATIWAEVLRLDQVGVQDNFFELGGDSILAIQVVARARRAGLYLTPRELFLHQTIAELSSVAGSAAEVLGEQGAVVGAVPLTPIQRRFFSQEPPEPHHMNQAVLLEVVRPLPAGALEEAVARLCLYHDALRLRFTREGPAWHQFHAAPDEQAPFVRIDLSLLSEKDLPAAVAAAAGQLQASLDLARGPILRVALFADGTPARGRLLIVIHHLAVDGVSWRILLEDLSLLLAQRDADLPSKTTSFQAWARLLAEHGRSPAALAELDYWLAEPRRAVRPLPVDDPAGLNTVGSARSLALSLTAEETRVLLQEAPRAFRAQINDLLLTALLAAFARWTGEPTLLVDLEGHGREEIFEGVDLSRTVGWFTSTFPVLLRLEEGSAPGASLKSVKEQLRQVPRRGIGYGILCHLCDEPRAAELAALPQPQVVFNYLGQFDSVLEGDVPLRPSAEPHGPTQSPRQMRWHLIELSGLVREGRLRCSWVYSENVHRRSTIQSLAAEFLAELRALTEICASGAAVGCTPSDFPLARLDQQALDRVVVGREIDDLYPLSPLQQGLLFHGLGTPESDVYLRQLSCTLRGDLDIAAFRRACDTVVERHPILRTDFVWQELAEPLQRVWRDVRLTIEALDWRDLSEAERRARLQALRAADRARGFRLDEAPLMRLSLACYGERTHELVWSYHHLISDGWSFPLLVADLFAFYEAYRRGEELERPRPRPFRDYIAWLGRQDLSAAERFWRQALAGFTTPTPVAADREARGGDLPGDEVRSSLSAAATASLQAWAKECQLTLNTVVQGAWALLSSRCGGGRDVVFGAVSSGRTAALPGIESMLGVFINTLAMRIVVDPEAPLAEWLRSIQQWQVSAREFEYSPLAQVQGWSEVARGVPLLSTLTAFENYPVDAAFAERSGSLEVTGVEFPEATNYPLTLMTAPGTRLPLRLLYDRQRFDRTTIERRLGHLQAFLEAFPGSGSLTLRQIPMLSAAERHQILREWNDTAGDVRPCLIHQPFEDRAAAQPDAVAVLCGTQVLTYGEVERQANRLARHLRALGVRRGDLVAVHLDRSAEMVPALLGVLKAGASYVPLDADYPGERLQWIVESLGIRVLVTEQSRLAGLQGVDLPSLSHAVCVDAPASPAAGGLRGIDLWSRGDLERRPPEPLPAAAEPDDIAYIIFTSGSTGRPKGVVLRHRPVVNLIRWVNTTCGVGAGDRVLFVTSLCFDLSVYDIFGVLAAGGSIHVAAKWEVRDPRELLRVLRQEPITFWDSAPAALQQLVPFFAELPSGRGDLLRQVFLSGDWIPVGLPGQVRKVFPGARVMALGGATEAAIWSNFFPVEEVDPRWVSIPYGRPIWNARYRVLDERLEPSPLGVEGDLYIGGGCLASGYAGEPALTAERFLPDVFGIDPGARLYWTGDRARYLADGNLEFLGRRDHQVKIRGFRIELGEIESALGRHPAVGDPVVLAREDEPGHKRLVAYFVPRRQQIPEVSELRDFLASKLPDYMVPTAFVTLDALPVTANGKLDRRALPAPEANRRAGSRPAPRTPTEEHLAALWAELLRVEAIGIDDNFFELGGDSILSIQLVSRAAQAGIVITPRQVFEKQTVAELAAAAATPREPVADEGGTAGGPVPLTPAQHWFFEQELENPHHFNQAVLFAARETIDPAALERAAADLVRHHDALRLRFVATDRGWMQVDGGPETPVPFFRCDLSSLPETGRRAALEEAAQSLQESLDLGRGPVLRLALFTGGEGVSERFLVVAHHLVIDGVSWRILLENLETAYRQRTQGEEVRLPPAGTPFTRWARRLEEHVAAGGAAAELEYWLAAIPTEPPPLPVDHAGGENRAASLATAAASLDADETRALLQEVPRTYRTDVNAVLLTALTEAVGRWTGERRLLVELEGHGREEIVAGTDLSRTVGWFTSFVPVLLDLRQAAGPGDSLKAVKERLRAAPSRGVGHGMLFHLLRDSQVDALRALARPLISFNYLGQLDQAVSRTGPLMPVAEPIGASRSPSQLRRHLLDVSARVLDGRLQVTWAFSRELHRPATVQRLADGFASALRELIAHCRTAPAAVYTPSDFPLAKLDQETLDRVFGSMRDLEDLYPLSPTQQGLLFHSIYAPESGVYFQQLSCTFSGDLDLEALVAAWRKLVRRHPILRTAFVWESLEEPLQAVLAEAELPVERQDWSGLPPQKRHEALQAFLETDRSRGLSLDHAPLMRLSLLWLGEGACHLVWSHHHLLVDGWSVSLLLGELLDLYERLRAGDDSEPPRPRPYRDYLEWLQGRDAREDETFWRRELAGFMAPTPLGITGWLGGKERGGERELRVPSGLAEEVRSAARRCRVTLNTLVQGAWALLLSRYSGEADVVFGGVSSGRPAELAGAESISGLFITTLPVRARVPAVGDVGPWLRELQERQAEQRQHEHTPLIQVQAWSEVPRGVPLFESALDFINYPVAEALQRPRASLAANGFRFLERTHYPLMAIVVPGQGLTLRLLFSSAVDAVSASRLLGHLESLLGGLAQAPGIAPGALPLVSPAERHQATAEWNDTGVQPARETLLLDLLVEQAPELPAVTYAQEKLTHGELAARSDRLAAHLRALGVGPDVLVALFLERSVDLVVALLAVLKAGGAYLPLETSLPRPRLAFMLDDSRAPFVLTRTRLLSTLPEHSAAIVRIDDLPDGAIEKAPAVRPAADNLAYVLYTSGSTGHPKAVAVTHRGLANYLLWAAEAYPAGEGRGAPVHSPLSFDLTVTSLLLPLLAGRCVVLVPEEQGVEGLAAALAEGGFGLVKLTPAHLDVLQRLLPPERVAGCASAFVIGGEPLSGEQLAFWSLHAPGLRLINEYGPTETVVGCSVYEVPASVLPAGPMSIGRPIANTRILILDPQLRPVPIGVSGELCLGGPGVCRGYLQRPGLTAEKLVPDPFGTRGERLYRTGDLARLSGDGTIELLGRIDHQVKVRGFRIELGEIEAVLVTHPQVRQAMVIVRDDAVSRRLVAYVVPESGTELEGADLRRFLTERLPDYMVPTFFVPLAQLPLTPNGKVDRKALPAPDLYRQERGHEAPRTAVERELAAIWSAVLRIERVGVEDNFFELGGDSILSLQIVSRAHRAGLHLTPRQLFENPTVAGLAALAERRAEGPQERGSRPGPIALTPAQLWFFEQEPAEPWHFNQSVLLEVREPLAASALAGAVADLIAQHEALRLRFFREESEWRQELVAPAGPPPVTVLDLGGLPDGLRRGQIEAAAATAQAGFDLGRGPLLRALAFTLGPDLPWRLLLAAHHLVVDGVSWRVLLEDLELAYDQRQRGETVRLPVAGTSFGCWSALLVEHARSRQVAQELDYWLAQERERVQPLPVDRLGEEDLAGAEARVRVILDREETEALLQEIPRAYRTRIDDVLLAALLRSFAAWTGTPRLLLDLEGHGREEIAAGVDLSRTVGWFTTFTPVLLELPPGAGPGELLKSVKEQLRAVPGRGLGYGLLRSILPDPEVRGRLLALPQAEVAFNYLGQLDAAVAGTRFAAAREAVGRMRSPLQRRRYRLEVQGGVSDGRLWLSWAYGETVYLRDTIAKLAERFTAELRVILAHCRLGGWGYTSSDFPLAKLDQETLDQVVGSVQDLEDLYPLSPTQQGMLFFHFYAPESTAYFLQTSYAYRGEFDPVVFRRALEMVIERQTILRTGFFWDKLAEPLQGVYTHAGDWWAELDWRHVPSGEWHARVGAFLREDLRRGFDFSGPSLLRVTCISLAADVHYVTFTFHHLLLDGWSLHLVFRELVACYDAIRAGRRPELAPSPRFRDYIAWIQGRDPVATEAYWRRVLSGFTSPVSLAGDRSPGALPALQVQAGIRSVRLTERDSDAVRAMVRRRRLTPNTLVQGAWVLLLSRHSGTEDVIFGVTVSGRPPELPGIESMVGMLVSTLPARVKTSPDLPLVPWLHGIQEQQVELRQYEHSSLVQVQAWSGVPANQPLFDNILVFENYPIESSMAGWTGETTVGDVRAYRANSYPLMAMILPQERIVLNVAFDRARFDDVTATRLAEGFHRLLVAMAGMEEEPLSALSSLSPAERHQLLIEWNDTRADGGEGVCVHHLVEAQAIRTPDAVALTGGGVQLTYGRLHELGSSLAHRLAMAGIGPGARVPLLLESSPELVVAMLAVMRTGAAFVPLDGKWPAARRDAVLAELGGTTILVDREGPPDGPAPGWSAMPVRLDRGDGVGRPGLPLAGGDSEAPIYVIYTSGSTGRPKGVVVPHRGIVNRLLWMSRFFGDDAAAAVLQTTRYVYDSVVWQIFWPLTRGGMTVLTSPDRGMAPSYVTGLIADHGVTTADFVPAIFGVLMEDIAQGAVPLDGLVSLRAVVVGGEEMSAGAATAFRQLIPDVKLLNLYGPTEASIGCICHTVGAAVAGRVPIGRPISNVHTLILDRGRNLVPAGVPGELYLAGRCVGLGYLGDEEQTRRAFLPNIFPAIAGDVFYRTGDKARHLPDGSIEFLGRIDRQVKIRGFRIELEEIESVLLEHPSVLQAAAVDWLPPEGRRDRLLVAYVACRTGRQVSDSDLADFLRTRLPDYMVPTLYVALPGLPLTAGGKVDRHALPVPAGPLSSRDTGAPSPRTPMEELLAAIWAEVLRVDQVGVHDNFFDLGGHSLTAIQVVSRIRQAFRVEVALHSVFERPTVAALAQLLALEIRESPGIEEPPIVPVPRDGRLRLSFAQERLWFLDQIEPGTTAFNIPAVVMLGAELDVAALQRAFGEVVRRHESLRTTFCSVAGEPHQVISLPQPFSLPLIDLSALPPEVGERLARRLLEVQYAFDLEHGPLMRAALLALEGRRVLVVSLHHIVTDGWSMDVLVRELAVLYEAFSQGLPSSLPELFVQYADYAAWQRHWLQGPALEAQVSYWRQQLAGAPPLLDLPIDRPRPPRQTFRGARQRLDLSGDLRERLRRFGRQEGMTPFMILLAALQALLYRHTAEEDLSVGTFTANRDRVEIEGLIGFFVNTLVLRSRILGGAGFGELLRQVREVTLSAHAHQDLPFEKLLEELRPPRNLSHTPLFQVMLEFQNLPPVSREQSGIQRASGGEELCRANFDLTLRAIQQGDDLSLSFFYNRDLFDGPTIACMLGHFERLLESAISDPRRPLAELPMVGGSELHQIVYEWSRGPAARSAGEPVHVQIAARAAADPAALAIVAGDRRLTYGELDLAASRLAHVLKRIGVRPDSPVGLCADRSPEMLIGLVGILQAGGAYVPLDPAYPRERLAFMVAASGAWVLVAQRRWADLLPVGPERLFLDDLEGLGIDEADEPGSVPAVEPDHLAYLIFTSGSTGRPKAVAVSHGSLSRYVGFVGEELALVPGDRVLQFASISFDTAAEEIFPCLSRGAALVLRSNEMLGSPTAFLDCCHAWGVTVLDLPTAYWSELAVALEVGEAMFPSTVRAVVIGGEKASSDRVAAWWRGSGKACRLINTYGPTEATIVATACELSPVGGASLREEVPIGRPVPHALTYVADADRKPVPIGAAGELLLGGQGLARGYFGRPDLTAERFIPDPFTGEPGARLYRSGDRVRARRDGQLEFLGRIDRQVKVRGFRIEPGEIEEALLRHTALQDAAVAAWPDPSGGLRLAAYVVPLAGAETPDVSELRSFLKAHLPEYMLPAVFVALEELPRTPSGKVDRRALPAPDASRLSLAREIVPASTPIEEALAAIWREVLKIDELGVQDNFFELGGHSLLATQVLARIRNRLQIDLPLIVLFEMPTIEELALAFEEALLDRIERLGESADAESLLTGGLAR